MATNTLKNLQNRLDRQAIHQLRAEVAKLQASLELAETRAEQAEAQLEAALADADAWQTHAMDMMHQSNNPQPVGLTMDGRLLMLDVLETA